MFYQNLGGSCLAGLTGDQTLDGVTLTDIQSGYWSATKFGSIGAWYFLFADGFQLSFSKSVNLSGWAVR